MTEPTLKWARISELTAIEFHRIIALRESVFVVEQKCVYQDADERDLHCWHLMCSVGNDLAAYLRVADPGQNYAEPSIGRVVSSHKFRGLGLGRKLIQAGIDGSEKFFPNLGNRISAQAYLREFYARFGFVALGEQYLDDDIPHIEMLRLTPTTRK
jgi:ElaA protein